MPTGQTKIALPIPGVETRYVPVFLGPGVAGQQVDHGYMWPVSDADLGAPNVFRWDAIVCPNGDGYLISDGYGGSHALLWGWSGGAQTGNVWNGASNTSFGGGYVINPSEWVFLSVDWDGSKIRTYVNGVMDGIATFAGPRHSVALGNGGGKLYVMGSDHSNAGGKLAFLRGWEQQDPFANASTNRLIAFIPERRPGFEGFDNSVNQAVLPCNFWCDYTRPGNSFMDLSPVGYRGRWHPGRLQGIGVAAGVTGALNNRLSPNTVGDMSVAFPTWTHDNNCPLWIPVGTGASGEATRVPRAVPGGAKIFDSLQRPNQTYAYQQAPTLGSTEGGTLGSQVWASESASGRVRAALWGTLGGYAVLLDQGPAIAYVTNDSADMDVRVTRRKGSWDNGHTGLCFRRVSAGNYWLAYYNDSGNALILATVTANASPVTVATYNPVSTTWTMLRVVTSGTTITTYVDDGAGGWTQVGQIVGNATFQTGLGCGVGSGLASFATTSLWRATDFTCL